MRRKFNSDAQLDRTASLKCNFDLEYTSDVVRFLIMNTGTIKIRRAVENDFKFWADMRNRLWPSSFEHHLKEIASYNNESNFVAFVAEDANGKLVGFSEASVRPYANGCQSSPVPFAEGCWVDETYHNQGIGRKLIVAIEA